MGGRGRFKKHVLDLACNRKKFGPGPPCLIYFCALPAPNPQKLIWTPWPKSALVPSLVPTRGSPSISAPGKYRELLPRPFPYLVFTCFHPPSQNTPKNLTLPLIPPPSFFNFIDLYIPSLTSYFFFLLYIPFLASTQKHPENTMKTHLVDNPLANITFP